MADFAANNTSRYKVRYSTAGLTHDMVFRYDLPASPPTAGTIAGVKAFLDGLANYRFSDWTVIGESWAAQGNSFFVPMASTLAPIAGTETIVTAVAQRSAFLSFVGLSALGNQARIMMFGTGTNPISTGGNTASNWRITALEDASIANAVNNLNILPDLVAIDSQFVVFHPYANFKNHSHYVYKAR
jgi:hypothetical protein